MAVERPTMPRFYFDFEGDGPPRLDPDGSDLPDRIAASEEVVAVLPELAKGGGLLGPEGRRVLTARVRDQAGVYFFEGRLALTARWLDPPATA